MNLDVKVHSISCDSGETHKGKSTCVRAGMVFTQKPGVKGVREALLLSQELQKGHFCSLNSFSERSPGVAISSLSPRFHQRFMPERIWVQGFQRVN